MTRPNNSQQKRKKKKKRTCRIVDFSVTADHRVQIIGSEKRDMYLHLAGEPKKNNLWNMKVSVILIVIAALGKNPKRTGKRIGRLGNKMTSRDYPDYNIIKIGQNTEKSPGDLKRLTLTQTPVGNHQLTLVPKTLKGANNDNNNNSGKLETTCCLSKSKERLSANPGVKNSQEIIIIIMIIFTNSSARAGYDTRSIFKRSLTGLNSEFSFS